MCCSLNPIKDPLCCSSYRPIALLNMDLKILTKMMKVLHYLVSLGPDQIHAQKGHRYKPTTGVYAHTAGA